MRGVLIGVAASIAAFASPAAPAAEQSESGSGFTSLTARPSGHSARSPIFRGNHDDGRRDRHDRRRFRDFGGDIFYGDREYHGDTLWRPGSFNDWWHDRPERSFPRWVGTNANCERQWWSGSGWRC